jgi:hypothetical protein
MSLRLSSPNHSWIRNEDILSHEIEELRPDVFEHDVEGETASRIVAAPALAREARLEAPRREPLM